ncbi:MAG: exosortase A [Pseudomonadota bacterium]
MISTEQPKTATPGSAAPTALSPAVVFSLAAVLVIAGLSASYVGMYELWQRSAHQHGLVVFPVVLWLIWRDKDRLDYAPGQPGFSAIALLLVNLAVWLLARLAGIQAIEHLAALVAVPLVVTALAGWQLAWKLRFPLAFLLLALPISDALVPVMMRWTADISEALLALFGIPFLRIGQNISLPGGEFVVAEVCSGVRYFTAGMLTLLLFAYLSFASITKRLVLLAIGAGLLVLANGVRAFIVMAVASATEMRLLGGADHIYFGWVMFGIVIISLMWVAGGLADAPDDVSRDERVDDTDEQGAAPSRWPLILMLAAAMLVATLNPLQSAELRGLKFALAAALVGTVVLVVWRRQRAPESGATDRRSTIRPRFVVALAAVAAVVVAFPWFEARIAAAEPGTAALPFLDLPDNCAAQTGWDPAWQPVMRGVAAERNTRVQCADGAVSVYTATYDSALRGAELVSGGNRPVPRSAGSGRIFGRGNQPTVREVSLTQNQTNQLVWFWYEVGDNRLVSPWRTKWRQVQALLRGQPAGGRIIVVVTDSNANDLDPARQRLAVIAAAVKGP